MIGEFKGDYRWLSNFWPVTVKLDGFKYPSTEHAYQAAKTVLPEAREAFADSELTAGQAKRLGRSVQMRSDWEVVRLSVMEDLLRQKFAHAELRQLLLATGDQLLVEGNNWNDTFWGVCRGKGENHLGKLLMKIREELRVQESNSDC